MIIFSSDNGGPKPGKITDNGPLRAGKGTLYEGGIRVCAAVNWPGKIPAGKTVSEPLHGMDWYPTILKLAGASAEQKLPVDGNDIWPVLTAGAKSPHESLLICGMNRSTRAVRIGDWKLLMGANDRDAEEAPGEDQIPASAQLYNLANDMGEKNDLAKTHPEKVKELLTEMNRLMKDSVAPGDGSESAMTKPKK